jgi:hypothetical protein
MPTRRTRTDSTALRALLATQSDEAAAEAIQTGGRVSAERLEGLGRLARLVELRDAAMPARNRWTVPLVALGTLGCVSVLLFVRVSSTEIELEAKVSELSFVVPKLQVITDAMNLSALGVFGLSAVELPAAASSRPTSPAVSVLLAADTAGRRTGTVSLDPITLREGARVSLRKAEGRHRYWMSLREAGTDLGASLRGPVRLVVSPGLDEVNDYTFPRRVGLKPDSSQVILEFSTAETSDTRVAFRSPLLAESLFLFRRDRFQHGAEMLAPLVPTIQSGTLYLESLNGKARPLRAGEGLHLAWSGGEIRELVLGDDGVVMRFHGMVRGMSTGSGEVKQSLMPTLLEWLRARHGLSLLWGTTAYVVGLFVAVLSWWRRPG